MTGTGRGVALETSDRNRVTRTDGVATKLHGGVDGAARAARAAAALGQAAAFSLPVPEVVALDGARLTTVEVAAATDGAALLATDPHAVLRATGWFAHELHALPPPMDWPLPTAPPATFVHGDLCPVNLLFDDETQLVAVLDWEDSRMDDGLVDLAWSEWLVRAWHHGAIDALPELYAAYGSSPPEEERRRAAMAACLQRQADIATEHDERALWDHRLAALPELDLRM